MLFTRIILNIVKENDRKENMIGRQRKISYEYILDNILHILKTGSQWSNMKTQNCSWKTIYHYFTKWTKLKIFERAYFHLLNIYKKIYPRNFETLIVDTTFVKNVFGRDCVGPSPVDRGRNATKVSAMVDKIGIPLHFLFHKGNKNDCKTFSHLIDNVQHHTELKGAYIYADKIYDTIDIKNKIREIGAICNISKKRTRVSKENNKIRIVVEHTFSWIDQF